MATKICKICGNEYEYCKTKVNTGFRWLDVACCPEHGAEYFKQIAIARGEIEAEEPKAETKALKKNKKKNEPAPVVEESEVVFEEEVVAEEPQIIENDMFE